MDAVRLLHTSDWHIGRSFHGYSTTESIEAVLLALAETVRTHAVDVVLVSGDVFDSVMPAAEHFAVLSRTLERLRAAGAIVVLSSGNHDSAARLGFQSAFARFGGIHVITAFEPEQPVVVDDAHGQVAIFGIPYQEPWRTTHRAVLGERMDAIRAHLQARPMRSVVLAHCFAANVPDGVTSEVERDITAGGVGLVPIDVFDGPDYVALGHLHTRAVLSERVRYSGAPLHYGFGEAGRTRGAWIIDLDDGGLAETSWVDLPIPRALRVVTGTLDELLAGPIDTATRDAWVKAVLTDPVRPMDAMPRLLTAFPFCAAIEHRPPATADAASRTYTERVGARSDAEIIASFLEHVRAGNGPDADELAILTDVLDEIARAEAAR